MSPSSKCGFVMFCIAGFALVLAFPSALLSQDSSADRRSRPLITEGINETRLRTLAGNTLPRPTRRTMPAWPPTTSRWST